MEQQMTFEIYNTLSRSKQPLRPIEPGRVGMYVCGMTVTTTATSAMGAFRGLRRDAALAAGSGVGCQLRAQHHRHRRQDHQARGRERRDAGELTERFIRYMHEDFAALGLKLPDAEPRATEYVPQMLG